MTNRIIEIIDPLSHTQGDREIEISGLAGADICKKQISEIIAGLLPQPGGPSIADHDSEK